MARSVYMLQNASAKLLVQRVHCTVDHLFYVTLAGELYCNTSIDYKSSIYVTWCV